MAICPFAIWKPISGDIGHYTDGPFRIVHHTTEGQTAKSAMETFLKNRSDPHFTIDETTVYQHIDTDRGARSLRNLENGVQTNRQSAIQIEVVGTASYPKNLATLKRVARVCRWLEREHNIPLQWPNGFPLPAKNGHDPGGHNRNPANWTSQGGHYGHCHVPENKHWDPGYTKDEVSFLMEAYLNDNVTDSDVISNLRYLLERFPTIKDFPNKIKDSDITMPDHGYVNADNEVDNGQRYLRVNIVKTMLVVGAVLGIYYLLSTKGR